jgi:alpha-ketoglutarate-dependent taurine dioxygenase
MARQSAELSLVQPLYAGRHGLLVDDTAIQVAGMEFTESEAFLAGLRNWATQPAYVYRHIWQPGDLVIWNSASVLDRELPRPENPMWKMAQSRR